MAIALRLGVNIDHVATVRNARGGSHPDPVQAACASISAGADGITVHLREDRRHIRDEDIRRLSLHVDAPLNMEMAPTWEMCNIATRFRPHAACLVPERRQELTTEGGLDVAAGEESLQPIVYSLNEAGCRVSLFIDPDFEQLDVAKRLGAPVVELHTGQYCEAEDEMREYELQRIVKAANHADALGLECHAGHGLSFDTVGSIASIPIITELNIGHFLIGESIFCGLEDSIKRMRSIMDQARNRVISVRGT